MALDNPLTLNLFIYARLAISQGGCVNIWHAQYFPFPVENVKTTLRMNISSLPRWPSISDLITFELKGHVLLWVVMLKHNLLFPRT